MANSPVVQLRVPADLLVAIDSARGDETRSAWLIAAARQRIEPPVARAQGQAPRPRGVTTSVSGGAAEMTADDAPKRAKGKGEQCGHRNWDRYCAPCGRLNDSNGYRA
jgi:hypothetical protein